MDSKVKTIPFLKRKFNNRFYSPTSEIDRKVYNSKRWHKMSELWLQWHPVCEHCGTIYDLCVHHKEEFSKHPENYEAYAYNWDNLQTLCRKCHQLEHLKRRNNGEQ